MSTPNLGNVITNPFTRKVIYGVYVVALVIAGAIQVAYSSLGHDQPDWMIATAAVLLYLGIPVGGLAFANATKPQELGGYYRRSE